MRTGLLTTIPFSHIPIYGNEKIQPIPTNGIFLINSQKWEQNFQPIPNVGKLNSINSQSQMGTRFSIYSQWGEMKLETGNFLISIEQNTF